MLLSVTSSSNEQAFTAIIVRSAYPRFRHQAVCGRFLGIALSRTFDFCSKVQAIPATAYGIVIRQWCLDNDDRNAVEFQRLQTQAESVIRMPRSIKAVALTNDSFKPFGEVISKEACRDIRSINRGQTARFNNLAALTLNGPGLEPCLSIFQTEAWAVPGTVTELERHPLTSQAFIPLGEASYLVIVAPMGPLKEEAIQAFVASPFQGVNYHPGVWHHRNLALNAAADFLVIDADGSTENCDEQSLIQPIEINL